MPISDDRAEHVQTADAPTTATREIGDAQIGGRPTTRHHDRRSMGKHHRTIVVYVYVPGPEFAEPTRRFVESYRAHSAGRPHELIIAAKCDHVPVARPLIPGRFQPVGVQGWDIGPFLTLAPELRDYDRIVLLGAYTRILVDGWLEKLCDAGPLASATGSWEERPHLRTSALSVHPSILNWMTQRSAITKQECYAFEHGPDCLYQTALKHGITGVVVGRDGTYLEQAWADSRTFRAGDQTNLMIADNQTDGWAAASPERRAQLTQWAWQP